MLSSSELPPGARPVELAGRRLILLPQCAAFDPESGSLMVADVHLGKAASFRSLGVPVPAGTTDSTLGRLGELIRLVSASTLFVLGDLLHGPRAQAPSVAGALARWRERHPSVRMVLVRGNHDARAGDPPPGCGFEVAAEPPALGPLRLCHDPDERDDGFVLAGHVHPSYRLGGRADSVRLPCFWLRERSAVLPAFGDFTGGWTIAPEPGDRVFVTDRTSVRPVPLPATAARPTSARRHPRPER